MEQLRCTRCGSENFVLGFCNDCRYDEVSDMSLDQFLSDFQLSAQDLLDSEDSKRADAIGGY